MNADELGRWPVYLNGQRTSTSINSASVVLGAERITWIHIVQVAYPSGLGVRLKLRDGSRRRLGFDNAQDRAEFTAALAAGSRFVGSTAAGAAPATAAVAGPLVTGQPATMPYRPSVVPTVLVSFFFGLFGLIPAIIHSRMAAERGYSTARYWAAFAVAMAASVIFWIGASLVLVATGGGAAGS
jgi:hypothetical protein